ncbi:MAG: hypothetical protein JKY37_31610 [Nannocystaceae bacterium]|nr:hypothetical protein [Nannocystaceae bacterium]
MIGELAPLPPPPTPTDAVVARLRQRLAGLHALADTLTAHADDIDPATAAELLVEVDAVAEALHDALD